MLKKDASHCLQVFGHFLHVVSPSFHRFRHRVHPVHRTPDTQETKKQQQTSMHPPTQPPTERKSTPSNIDDRRSPITVSHQNSFRIFPIFQRLFVRKITLSFPVSLHPSLSSSPSSSPLTDDLLFRNHSK